MARAPLQNVVGRAARALAHSGRDGLLSRRERQKLHCIAATLRARRPPTHSGGVHAPFRARCCSCAMRRRVRNQQARGRTNACANVHTCGVMRACIGAGCVGGRRASGAWPDAVRSLILRRHNKLSGQPRVRARAARPTTSGADTHLPRPARRLELAGTHPGAKITPASGGSVTTIECGCPWYGMLDACAPLPLPRFPPP